MFCGLDFNSTTLTIIHQSNSGPKVTQFFEGNRRLEVGESDINEHHQPLSLTSIHSEFRFFGARLLQRQLLISRCRWSLYKCYYSNNAEILANQLERFQRNLFDDRKCTILTWFE